jgi:hypothetical protein
MTAVGLLSILSAAIGLGFLLQAGTLFRRLLGIEVFFLGLVGFIPVWEGGRGAGDFQILILSTVVGVSVSLVLGWVLLVLEVRRGGE